MVPVPAGIDRRSSVPFYSQLKDIIVADIVARGLEAGDRLPGDHELCERYDISRTVVRQALLELEHEGFIRREKGRGTFVHDPRTSRGIGGALVGSFEDIQGGEGAQHSRLLRRGFVPASARVASDLGVDEGTEVVEIERLREVDGEPWAFTRTQLPRDVGEPLLHAVLEDVSLFGILEREYGVVFERAQRTIVAEQASDQVAEALRMVSGAPVLVMRSVSFDRAGRAIERFAGFHRGDRSRLDVEVRHLLA
ncbi:GntR family transcriptional regulator [Microbacterium marinilacus]|nr:GntR family transcriptional regulator [Microbacterium marinilacus]MBY0689248.1 GntR family transcriptional regulator [Microbacterium marinilacus]